MGAKLCCMRKQACIEQVSQQPESCKQIKLSRPQLERIRKRKKAKTQQMMTLEDYLLASPGIHQAPRTMGGENHDCKQISKRVHPSYSPEVNAFFTPRLSFSKTRILGKIKEENEVGLETPMDMTPGGSSSRKKVRFKLPEEADIIFYSPWESFEE
ncbi:hypothetical protein LIER_30433 [Lithospermum erythrorhizon]|uniref:Uncharacterized protein n=1 Tax=Lithospermum erythrorhizon TaxID=34254 RepID=A0AAV3RQX0_LITER